MGRINITFLKIISSIRFGLLAVFFFLLACFSKQFAYIHFNLGNLPIYVSEFTLFTVILLRWPQCKTALLEIPAAIRWAFLTYLCIGLLRYVYSIHEGSIDQIRNLDILQQTCLTYQALWFLIGISFSAKDSLKLLYVAILGTTTAQFLGWLGFYLLGTYSIEKVSIIGFPVGNEVINPLYLFAFHSLDIKLASFCAFSFGHLWMTQILVYVKRSWVFSIAFFCLPFFFWIKRKQVRRVLLPILLCTILGSAFSLFTVYLVHQRSSPIYYSLENKEQAKEQRAYMHKALLLLGLIEFALPSAIYQFDFGIKPSFEKKFFHGELVKNQGVSLMAFRMFLWKKAWDKFLDRPIIGNGYGPHFTEIQLNGTPAIVDGKWISGPHNSFLSILFRFGIIGALIFVLFIGQILHQFFLQKNKTPVAFIALSVFLSTNFFAFFNVCLENPQGGIWYWFFLGWLLRAVLGHKQDLETKQIA